MQTNESNTILEVRAKDWGDPVMTHARIAQVWSGILDTEVTPHQVALMMTGLKLVRASINPDNEDSLVDAGAYVEIGKRVMIQELDTPIPFVPQDPADVVTRLDLRGAQILPGGNSIHGTDLDHRKHR